MPRMGAIRNMKSAWVLLLIILSSTAVFAIGTEFFAPKSQGLTLRTGEVTSFRAATAGADETQLSYAWYSDGKLTSSNPFIIYTAGALGMHKVEVTITEAGAGAHQYFVAWDVQVVKEKQGGGAVKDCVPIWQCTLWAACDESGSQARDCQEIHCGLGSGGPATFRTCQYQLSVPEDDLQSASAVEITESESTTPTGIPAGDTAPGGDSAEAANLQGQLAGNKAGQGSTPTGGVIGGKFPIPTLKQVITMATLFLALFMLGLTIYLRKASRPKALPSEPSQPGSG